MSAVPHDPQAQMRKQVEALREKGNKLQQQLEDAASEIRRQKLAQTKSPEALTPPPLESHTARLVAASEEACGDFLAAKSRMGETVAQARENLEAAHRSTEEPTKPRESA